jgi:hypothetical protein
MISKELRGAMTRTRVCLHALALLALVGCNAERVVQPEDADIVDGPDVSMLDVPRSVPLPTYDGSGQTVHPDVAHAPSWFPNRHWYMAVTPYPNGNVNQENPSLFYATDPFQWKTLPGASNPVVRPPKAGYLSDPDIVFNPDTKELFLYYREFITHNVVKLVRSSDGVSWSAPVDVVDAPSTTAVSPSVVRRGPGQWEMWTVDAGELGCRNSTTSVTLRRSADGVRWSPPSPVDLAVPVEGFSPWHIEVQWLPSRNEYWAVYNAKIASNCATTVLFLATSPDGVTWTSRPIPLLVAGEIAELRSIVYRTAFIYSAATDIVTFWFSGAARPTPSSDIVWSTVVKRYRRADVYARTGGQTLGALRIPKPIVLKNPP